MSAGNGAVPALPGRGGRLPPEERERIRQRNLKIVDALNGGRRQCDVAKDFGISKATVNNIHRFIIRGEKPWKKSKKQKPPPSEGAAIMNRANAELRRAQAEVLLAEAEVKNAEALCLRERALALKRQR